jgi:hypothetical protein
MPTVTSTVPLLPSRGFNTQRALPLIPWVHTKRPPSNPMGVTGRHTHPLIPPAPTVE